jgi:hypothetical protein
MATEWLIVQPEPVDALAEILVARRVEQVEAGLFVLKAHHRRTMSANTMSDSFFAMCELPHISCDQACDFFQPLSREKSNDCDPESGGYMR